MTTDLATTNADGGLVPIDEEAAASALEHILATGDLAKLTAKQRVGYYLALTRKLGLAAESRPFDWLTLDGRLVLYPNKSCAEQIRRTHQISIKLVRKERVGDLFCVEVEGRRPNGQSDFASKYVPLKDARGAVVPLHKLGDVYAKAETGAKRRLTFSMVGISASFEAEDLHGARVVTVDGLGNVLEHPTEQQRHLAERPAIARVIGEPTFETTATAEDSPLPATANQAPTPEELERPRRQGPAATFKPSAEDVRRWLGAWHAAVKGTYLEDAVERHKFFRQWTSQYPEGVRTESSREFFAHATERQAGDLLAHVRAIVDDEKRSLLDDLTNATDEPEDGTF
jgi:hypothetical protein